MNCELIKAEFIQLKRDELDYVDNIVKISSHKILSESEKFDIYRMLNRYKVKLNEILQRLQCIVLRDDSLDFEDIIIEFDLDKNYLSSLKFYSNDQKNYILKSLGVDTETLKFKLTLYDLIQHEGYRGINADMIQNNQNLIDRPIYVFVGYYDASEDNYGPLLGNYDDYIDAIYVDINNEHDYNVPKKEMREFEKDKIIIYSKEYVQLWEIKKIFKEELLDTKNKTLMDCVIQTRNKIDELNYIRSPEYKKKVLLDKIGQLYEKVKGKLIKSEILYNGNFLQVLMEVYKLPNQNIVSKEKVIKNSGKDSVIVIAITKDKEYIITIQNRIKDKLIMEFPSGYIESDESLIETAKRELKEETGYVSDDLFIIDEAYTSPGIDNSKSYIIIASNCTKIEKVDNSGTEFVSYGLFSRNELEYLINQNIMSGATNKLAYYNLINNFNDDCNFGKNIRKKTNPFLN